MEMNISVAISDNCCVERGPKRIVRLHRMVLSIIYFVFFSSFIVDFFVPEKVINE
jgi:hypothetical protein